MFVVSYSPAYDGYSSYIAFIAESRNAAEAEIERREARERSAFVAERLNEAIDGWRESLVGQGVPEDVAGTLNPPVGKLTESLIKAFEGDGQRKVYSVSAALPVVRERA